MFEVFKENYFRVSCFNGCTGFSPGGQRYDFYTPKNSNPLGPRTLKVLVRWIRGTLPLPTPTHTWIRGTFTHTHATQTHPRQRTPTTHVHTCACTSYTVVFFCYPHDNEHPHHSPTNCTMCSNTRVSPEYARSILAGCNRFQKKRAKGLLYRSHG